MRALTAIAALAAALALLAGCGGDEEASTATTSSTTSTPATGPTGPDDSQPTEPGDSDQDGAEDKGGGGGDAPTAGGTPEDALEAFFTSGDPDLACGDVVTESLVTENYGDVKGCRQAQVPGAVADSIEVENLQVDGDSATAVVVPTGGPNDGFDHDVVLVREGDTWLVDSIEADIPAGP